MNKAIAFILSLVITMTSLPICVSAEENTTKRAELLSTACDVFPEYASTISNDGKVSSVFARSIQEPYMVISETRPTSENSSLTYTGYSDGSFMITSLTYTPYEDYSYTDYESTAYAAHVTADIEATVSDSGGLFELSGVSFSLINGSYDIITNEGTSSYNSFCKVNTHLTTQWSETSSTSPAFIGYHLEFQYHSGAAYHHSTKLYINVGNNTFTVKHDRLD